MIDIKIGNFEPESLYAKSLIPILDALKWSGSNVDLMESLVDKAGTMGEDGLIETLANLKFKSFVSPIGRFTHNSELYPSLYIQKKNMYVVVGVRENFFMVYNARDSRYEEVEKLKRGRKIILFSPLNSVDFNLFKPQKNWFFHLLTRFKKEFIYTLLISFLLTVISFITPLFIMLIHSQVRIARNWNHIAYLGVAALIFIVGGSGFKALRSYLLTYLSSRIGNLVSRELFRRILYLPPKYIETSSVQSQINRIRDFESITDFFSGPALLALIDIPLALLMLVGITFIGGSLVFVPLSAYVLLLGGGVTAYYGYKRINQKSVGSVNQKNRLQNEMLNKMTEIRLTGNKERWISEYEKYTGDALHSSFRSSGFLLIVNALSHSVVNITLVLSIAVSVSRVLAGEMDSGALFSSIIIISRIMAPLKNGFSTMSQFSKIRRSITQLNKFMELQIEDRPGSLTVIQDQLDGDIRFNNVFLKYGQEITPALINVKFLQKQYETTVITGHGGCGKSSLIKVLLGMYQPLSGTVTIDNTNIMQLDKLQLRKSVSYLPAKPYLFPGSVKFNLFMARPDATELQVDEALTRVGIAEELYSLPYGLDTEVKDMPDVMQKDSFKKKLNFAMMLLRDFPVLIIDGIEVGLDIIDYYLFFNILDELKGRNTIILTTGTQEFIELADKVVVIDSGRVLKTGSPDEILRGEA